jgi:predicted CopG family antitoxin
MKNYRKKLMTISVTEEVYQMLKNSSNNMSSFICDLVKDHHHSQKELNERVCKALNNKLYEVEL